MIRKIVVPMLALGALMAPAFAETTTSAPPQVVAAAAEATAPVQPPQVSSAEDCKQVGLDLAQIAEDRRLSDAKLDTLEDLMSRMSDFCAESKFVEANALAQDLKTLIDKM